MHETLRSAHQYMASVALWLALRQLQGGTGLTLCAVTSLPGWPELISGEGLGTWSSEVHKVLQLC